MYIVDWDEGMSVGVKALDDDHKRLLDTINKLYSAIDDDANKEVLEAIFTELENYVIGHFSREEAFLKKCNYEGLAEHIKEHEQFALKVPELKR